MWTILMTAVALAAPVTHTHDQGRIAVELQRGELTRAEAAWLSYLSHVEPEALPGPYADEVVHTDGGACLTGLVMELETVWDELDATQRTRISEHLSPDGTDLFGRTEGTIRSMAGSDLDECVLAEMDNSLVGDRFVVYWDDGIISSSTANQFLTHLENGWDVQIDELGWDEPEGTNDYYIGAYVTSGGASAYTTVTRCGRYYTPYIVAGSGSFSGGTWYQDMATHEFHHAVQFGYGYAFEFFWWEASATYIQDDVYPSHEWWSTYVTGYTDNPWMAMNVDKTGDDDYDVFYHQYGMAIMGFYLDQHVGGEDMNRQLWDYSSRESGTYTLSLWDAVEGLGYDWDEVIEGFVATNTVMDYEDRNYYPDLDVHKTISDLPKKAEANTSRKLLGQYGQNYIEINTSLATDDEPHLTVEVESGKNSAFRVWLVSASNSEVKNIVEVALEDGDGEGYLPDFGGYKKAWAIVTPTADDGNFEYTLRFDQASDADLGLEDEDTDGGSDTDTDADGPSDDAGGDGECGCSAGGLAGMGWLLPLLGAGVVRRRRIAS